MRHRLCNLIKSYIFYLNLFNNLPNGGAGVCVSVCVLMRVWLSCWAYTTHTHTFRILASHVFQPQPWHMVAHHDVNDDEVMVMVTVKGKLFEARWRWWWWWRWWCFSQRVAALYGINQPNFTIFVAIAVLARRARSSPCTLSSVSSAPFAPSSPAVQLQRIVAFLMCA